MSLLISILQKAASKINAELLLEPEYKLVGHITFKNGKKTVFSGTRLNVNGYGSSDLARDKHYTKYFLKQFGYKITEGQTFFHEKLCASLTASRNIDDGFNYAQNLGFPVIMKPLNLRQGVLVTKVYNSTQYYEVAGKILEINPGFIVERFYGGNDYRILVFDNEVIAAYQRIPFFVIGNGEDTVEALIQAKQAYLIQQGRKVKINLSDFRIAEKLQRQNLSFQSIIPKNTTIYLLDNANLSSGGEAVDFTEHIHPNFQKLAINITKDMGLRLAGVDIISDDITQPTLDYTLIEVNSAPSLSHYATGGNKQMQRVEDLYLKILKSLENSPILS
jgi:D-alanine-D-alanine ligase-like ATP-grasp enzyme